MSLRNLRAFNRFIESSLTNRVYYPYSSIGFDTTSSASARVHSHNIHILSDLFYRGHFSPFDNEFEGNPTHKPETRDSGSSFPTNSLLLAGTIFENPRPAPSPNEAAKSDDNDQLVELSLSPALQLIREIDTWEAATEVTGSDIAPTTETDDAQTEVDFSSWRFPSSVRDSSSNQGGAATPTPRSPQARAPHQVPTELSPELKLDQLLFGSMLFRYGQDAISPKTKTLNVFSDPVTSIYDKGEKLTTMFPPATKRMCSEENAEPRPQKWEQTDLPLQPIRREELADEQPDFTNPWDGNKCIESRRTDWGVVYSTESAWRKLRTARTTRKYFGSDDDEIYIPPHFSFPRSW